MSQSQWVPATVVVLALGIALTTAALIRSAPERLDPPAQFAALEPRLRQPPEAPPTTPILTPFTLAADAVLILPSAEPVDSRSGSANGAEEAELADRAASLPADPIPTKPAEARETTLTP